MFFIIVYKVFLEHQVSQESPKTAKKPPKMAPGSHQEPFKKWVSFLTPFLFENGPQNAPQSDPTMIQKLMQNMTPQKTKKRTILGNKINPKKGPRTIPAGRDSLESSCFQDGSKMAQDGPSSLSSPLIQDLKFLKLEGI